MTPEEKARLIIDEKLCQSGWIIQDMNCLNLAVSLGVAVREFPTSTGEVDYALFIDGQPVGVVEAKREEAGQSITDVEIQSGRYAKSTFKYFAVGEERLEVLDSKVENENFYLLTLVAIAKELEIRGKSEADVVLAVGLPLTRFSAERKPFIDYLSQNRDVVFGFEQKLYTIHILNVLVYPQCYAAVAGIRNKSGQVSLLSVVLIGSVGCGSKKDLSTEVTNAESTEVVNETVEPTTEAVTVETEDAKTAQQESTGAVTEVDSSVDTKSILFIGKRKMF